MRTLGLVMLLAACSAGAEQDREIPPHELVTQLSSAARSSMTATVGQIAEARYAAGGTRVVILSRSSPHLLLFSSEGALLWRGLDNGPSDPKLIPQAVAVSGDTVIVLEPGRATLWMLNADTLSLEGTFAVRDRFPFGVTTGCSGNWLMHARDEQQFGNDRSMMIDYLHSVDFRGGLAEIAPLWADARDLSARRFFGHTAATISRFGERVVVWHRSNTVTPGQLMEFDCGGALIHAIAEASLVLPDSLPIKLPRASAPQWTAGVTAIRDGMLVAMLRWVTEGEPRWNTEIVHLHGGEFLGSVVLEQGWFIMDYDSTAEMLLLSTAISAEQHFVHVPVAALAAPGGGR